MTTGIGNVLESLPETLDEELFTEIIRGENVKIERIVSKGHASPASGWYDQDCHEWVVVLKGAATLSFANGDDVQLRPGSHLNIPAHTRHKVAWTTPDTETVWLAIHYT
ncbi:MAG TPA: cupin domain-containing protein [Pseudomonadales bacterium]|jgi:cupin 2 domain-containing protein